MAASELETDGTPTLTDVINAAVDARLKKLYTINPGHIRSLDGNKAEIQLHLKGPEQTSYPIANNIPVWYYKSDDGHIRIPAKVGNKGALLTSHRSLDNWQEDGQSHTEGGKLHDLSYGLFIPGLYPWGELDVPSENLEIKHSDGKISMSESGKYNFAGLGGLEIMDEMIKAFESLESLITNLQTLITTVGTLNTSIVSGTGITEPARASVAALLGNDFSQVSADLTQLIIHRSNLSTLKL